MESQIDDNIVAWNGITILGVGKIIGGYEYHSDERHPHMKKVDWYDTSQRTIPNEVRKLQVAGLYRDVELMVSTTETGVQQKEDQISGMKKSYQKEDYQLLEMHVDLNIEGIDSEDGIKVPYIVTLDEGSAQVLSIYRNYNEEDPKKKKKQYFVHYKFLPGFSFYGFGLIHMLGGLSRTATSALRQLIDAGTLSNLPAGFKARGLRIKDDDNPLQPGEFRDVDAPSGDLSQGLLPLPYKEPSQTLFALLGFVVEAGTRFASVADQKIERPKTGNMFCLMGCVDLRPSCSAPRTCPQYSIN